MPSRTLLAILLACAAAATEVRAHGSEAHVPAAAAAPGTSQAVELGTEAPPTVELRVAPESGGGYALALLTTGFAFGDALTPSAVRAGAASLTVAGSEPVRLDAPRHTVVALPPGNHLIEVELTTTDGARLLSGGRPVADRVVLRVPRGGGDAATGEARRFEIVLTGGDAREDTLRLTQGDWVRIDWRSDTPASLHLHGYDIEAHVEPGAPVAMQFRADIGGRFPVALHGAASEGGHGHSSLLYVEVYPD